MKKVMVVAVCLCGLLVSGCGEVATGAAAGGAAAGVLQGIQAEKDKLALREQLALERYKNAVTEQEKLAAEAELKVLEMAKAKLAETETAIKTGVEIAATDWSDATAAGGMGAIIANLLTVWYFNRKKKSV